MALARISGQPQPPCWCLSATLPPALRERIPPAARGLACVCAHCGTLPAPT